VTAPAVTEPGTKGPADQIIDLYGDLERQALGAGLEPSGPVDRIFAGLVDLCAPGVDGAGAVLADTVLADTRVAAVAPRLRALCADGEYRLELAWARRVAAARDAESTVSAFPYWENYRALTALELHTAAGLRTDPVPARICVLGSGPLPLTALLTARELGRPVDAVDVDPEATALAGDVLRRLPGGELVRPHLADAQDFPGVAEADLVVLAALVGPDPARKHAVIASVAERMRPGAVLLVRSAYGLRTLLYPPVGPADLAAAGAGRLRLLAEVHPLHEVVNSLVVAQRV
jgi:nicotianamine synthase